METEEQAIERRRSEQRKLVIGSVLVGDVLALVTLGALRVLSDPVVLVVVLAFLTVSTLSMLWAVNRLLR